MILNTIILPASMTEHQHLDSVIVKEFNKERRYNLTSKICALLVLMGLMVLHLKGVLTA